MSKTIKSSNGSYIIIDNDDYERLKNLTLYVMPNGYVSYKESTDKKRISKYIHRLIMNPKDGMEVDHINHNKLDNRQCNLRIVTPSQNQMNKRKNKNRDYKGITWEKNIKKWFSRITVNRKQIIGGYFENKKDAAKSYNKLSLKYHKDYGLLNVI